jgi:ankyrin repeat protein
MRKPPDDLLIAISKGEPIPADNILNSDFDVNAFGDRVERTVLLAASYAGRSDLIRELVRQGALVDLGHAFWGTSLHVAAANGHVDATKVLLDFGANIEAETKQGITPLMSAAAWGHAEVVDLLIARGANVHHRDHSGCTAQTVAEEKEEHEIAKALKAAETAGLA